MKTDGFDAATPHAPVEADGSSFEHVETVSEKAWWWWLGGICLVGLIIRLGSVLGRRNRIPGGDGAYYFNAARLLAGGKGWINPFTYAESGHHVIQTAAWPPLFVLVMAVPQALGLHTYLEARLWLCFFSLGAIALTAYAGREIVGRRVGLAAAALIALYPNIWMSVDLGLSEVLTPLLVAWVLWMSYRFWKRPGYCTAIWLGLSIGLTMLGRDELTLLAVVLLVPLVLIATSLRWLTRLKVLGVAVLTIVVVIGPWVGYNLSRFEKPVFISTGLGVTLASANCDQTYSGFGAGYWSFECAAATPVNPHADESVQEEEARSHALHYVDTHLSELPQVELDRLGRAFGLFRPLQQIRLDSTVETRPYRWALLGLGMYYVLFVTALGGTWVLRRRKIIVFPLWVVGLNVVVSTMIAFGDTRYRTAFEVPLVLLSAVVVDVALGSIADRRRMLSRST